MRVTESISYRNLIANVSTLNERLEQASQQVSSGSKLLNLHDGPAESAEMRLLEAQLSDIDQYQTNADNGGFFLQAADSALSSLNDLVTAVFTRGSAAASSYNDAQARSTLASEIRSLRDQILGLANAEVRGRYLFAGSRVTSPAFILSGDTATYQGDEEVNTVKIGDWLQVRQNLPGSGVFSPVFDAIEALVAALDGNDSAAIQPALGQVSETLATVSQARARLGVDLAKVQDSEIARLNQQLNIQTRKSHIGDADIAEAITRVGQVQTALEATLTVGSRIGQRNLFDYLG